MARNKPERESKKSISDIIKINKSIGELMQGESTPIFGTDTAGTEISRIHSMYHDIINSDQNTIMSSKPSGLSTYGFLANALAGGNYGSSRSSLTGDPRRDKWINRTKLEKTFTSSDYQMMSYFLSTNSDILHIYDEIDSICAYIYQLDEAVDVIRDCVLSSDSPGTLVNYEVDFPGVSQDDAVSYKDIVKEAFKCNNLNKKLSTLAIPKLIKYGTYYFIIIPYSEIGPKLNAMRSGRGGTVLFESTTIEDDIIPNVTSLFEYVEFEETSDEKPYRKGSTRIQKLSKHAQFCLENIKHNLTLLEIDESGEAIPNVFEDSVMENFDNLNEKVQKAAKAALNSISKNSSSRGSSKKQNTPSDGVFDPKQFEELPGCYINVCDPRRLRPVKIFDCIIGYYYLENYNYADMGTSITDILSNQMNFNEQHMVVDNLVNAVLSKLQYGDVMKGDQQFRNMILNCLLYAERRDSPIRIKFISPEYVVPFTTNEDEYGNGQPVLLRSLFYGRLYTSLLLFNITAIITKSTDTEFYWLKQSGLDQQYSNQVSDLIDQMKASNVDPLAIANGDILRGNSAINKRYYMNAGISGERPFDMEVVGGQQVDVHNDLLTDLRKMTIGASGVPSSQIDLVDEIQYATQLHMENIKNLKRCNTIQGDVDPDLTNLIRIVCKFNFPNAIPEEVLNSMEIKLKRSKIIEGNITSQQLNDQQTTAETMVETYLANNDTNPPEVSQFIKAIMKKELMMNLTSSAPWELLPEIHERAILSAKKMELEQKIQGGEDSQ